MTERTERIAHIPKVLYHWRIIASSGAADPHAKPYAIAASKRAREQALARRACAGTVEEVPKMPGQFRVNYHVQGSPKVSIIVPTKDNIKVLDRAIRSIRARTSYNNYEILVVDNLSEKSESAEYFSRIDQERDTRVLRYPHPFNFSKINNFAVGQCSGEVLLFLNNDTEVITQDWLERMLGYAQRPHIGAVGAQLLFPETGTIQHCGVVNLADGPGHAFYRCPSERPLYFGRTMLEHDWLAVTAACLMIERKKFEAVGGFDHDLSVAYNDVDFCFRLVDRGLYNVVCQSVQLYHYESYTRGSDDIHPEKRERLKREKKHLYRKHPKYYGHDPFHNPNLHPNSVHFITHW